MIFWLMVCNVGNSRGRYFHFGICLYGTSCYSFGLFLLFEFCLGFSFGMRFLPNAAVAPQGVLVMCNGDMKVTVPDNVGIRYAATKGDYGMIAVASEHHCNLTYLLP